MQIKLQIECPYCGHKTPKYYIPEEFKDFSNRKIEIIVCKSKPEGGCEKTFAIETSLTSSVKISKLNFLDVSKIVPVKKAGAK